MKQISNADYSLIIRLLHTLSQVRGTTIKENEGARKAGLLYKKLKKREDEETRLHKTLPSSR